MKDRSAPGVRITVLANERALTGEPFALRDRVISFSFEDSASKADKVTIELDNYDLSLFERDDLIGGRVIEVSWGYPHNMAPPRRAVVKKMKGFARLTVEAHAVSVLLNRHARTRAWQYATRSDVAREIAREYGYEGEFLEIEDTREVVEVINQVGETDARLLQRLAAREHFEFSVDDRGLHWRPRNHASPPTHVLHWFSDPGRGDILAVNVESDLSRRVGRVEVRGRDPLRKVNIESKATNASVERPTLGQVVEVVDRETGQTSLQDRNATTSVHTTSVATPAAAERESKARFRRAEGGAVKLTMQTVGDPTLRAKQVIEVRGISTLLSGKYHVTEAKHSITGTGYVVDLNLTRDAAGPRGAGKAATKGQPQAGEPNRADPATGGTMTAIEVVDRESGRTHIKYRRNGPITSGEDPESLASRAK